VTCGEVPASFDPTSFAAARSAVLRWSSVRDVHAPVAARLRTEALAPVLDIGCGDGELACHGVPGWLGADRSEAMAAAAARHGPVVVSDAESLPVADGSCGVVAALWCLYCLDDPARALAEARRALRPDGLFVACTTSRTDSPELNDYFAPPPATTFDAEEAPALVERAFGAGAVEIEAWDGPFITLPDRGAVAEYLRGRGASDASATEVSAEVPLPFVVTKRGVLVWARR
jgi:SAM-dependent methyltransferase